MGSKYIRILEPYFEKYDPEYSMLQQKMKEILQKEDDLQEIVQLVGKDSLSEDQKCTLETARIIREDLLQQNGFSDYDFMCPLSKTIGMMKVIGHFYDCAMKGITVRRRPQDHVERDQLGAEGHHHGGDVHEVPEAAPEPGLLPEVLQRPVRGHQCEVP